jgi:CHAT domain-containing protein
MYLKGAYMKKFDFYPHNFFPLPPLILFRFIPVFLLFLVAIFLLACAEKMMSIDKAKKVTVLMNKESFLQPPRRIDDILAILDQPGHFKSEIVSNTKAIADALPPETDNPALLAEFYLKRGLKARELGRSDQVFQDIHTALKYAEKARSHSVFKISNENFAWILKEFGQEEAYLGNFKQGIALIEQSLDIHKSSRGNPYLNLALLYFMAGDYNAGISALKTGIRLYNQQIRTGDRGLIISKGFLQAELLHQEGKFAKEELVRRSALKQMAQSIDWIKNYPRPYIYMRSWLAQNLAKQGRLIEAELEARRALDEALGHAGKESAVTARVVGVLGEIILSQKRLIDAEKLAIARTEIYEAAGASTNSLLKGEAIKFWCQVAVARLDFVEAMKRFDLARENFLDNQYVYDTFFRRDPDFIICLLKTGRFKEAIKSIISVYKEYREFFGGNSYQSAEMLSLRGMANAMIGKTRKAVKDFSESVPILLKEKTSVESDYLKNQRLTIILEAYLDLLTRIHGGKLEREFRVDASATGFKLVQAMIGSSVQSALGASGAREAALEPELADLVRREQDSLKQVNAFKAMLSNAIAVAPNQQNPAAIKDLQARIKTLKAARATLIDEIKRRFTKYSDFTDPQPVTFSEVQNHLHTGEVLISIYSTDNKTYVWAIPPEDEVLFSVVGVGKKTLRQIIARLRKALDPEPTMFGDIPEFDLAQAYDLYSQLLRPVEKGWENATDLLIVAHGPLDQLAFSVLPTSPVGLSKEQGPLFSNYRKVPWLIRKVSITRLPSAASFVNLRTLPKGDSSRRAFVGFGDPVFNPEQLAQMKNERTGHKVLLSSESEILPMRGIRITDTGSLDSEKITSCHLGSLNRLADTAEEIRSIAEALNANPSTDIFIGERASERQVKTMDLTDRRIIVFATHALVPGDLDGLDQPALALCSPSVTGETEDGLLTMGEIMKLRMNADWVVLSACNTGAADGAGAEAVSGLGRAFFYAGTRAILVSMWPVETTSARNLTTRLFHYQRHGKRISRARALRKSILELIDGQGLKDNSTGKIIASYAHPIFWAPFIIVGESGLNPN